MLLWLFDRLDTVMFIIFYQLKYYIIEDVIQVNFSRLFNIIFQQDVNYFT